MALECIQEQQDIIEARDQTILVTARPGRGKTTVALLFAEQSIRDGQIGSSQQILFLTFSRNAVHQIEQASGLHLDKETRKRLWIATYHSFMWWLLSVLGRFHGLPRRLEVMGGTRARTAVMAARREGHIEGVQLGFHLAQNLSAISYSDFAPLTLDLLRSSNTVRELVRHRFPVILVDEFQDTNGEQWELIKLLADGSRLICFADPDQMIYRWRGASHDRLQRLREERQAKVYPLQSRCLRTDEHDLLDFAEAILDDVPGTPQQRALYRQRFLEPYWGSTALGYYMKQAIRQFYSDFQHRKPSADHSLSIAVAAYSNRDAEAIRDALGHPTQKAPQTYRCSLLEGELDDVLDELLIHLAAWAAGDDRGELELAVQLVGGMLASDISKASRPVAALFSPKELLDGDIRPRGTAKHVVELFEALRSPETGSAAEVLDRAVEAVAELRARVKSVGREIPEADLSDRHSEMLRITASAPGGTTLSALMYLREKLATERLHRNVLERVTPVRGIVSSTLHKLKGREFDYVCIVTRGGDRLHGANEDESDARRLMYVALTRARFDARILYVESNPCLLLVPYLQS